MHNLGRIGWVATLYIKEKNRSNGLDWVGEDPIALDWIGRTQKKNILRVTHPSNDPDTN